MNSVSPGIGAPPRANQHHLDCCDAHSISEMGLVSRASPVQTALRNCTRDEGRSFEVGNQVLISSHRKLLCQKAMVVKKSGQDSDRQGGRWCNIGWIVRCQRNLRQ
jgi:hypothetical protein